MQIYLQALGDALAALASGASHISSSSRLFPCCLSKAQFEESDRFETMTHRALISSLGGLAIAAFTLPAPASPHRPGPCSGRLQSLGYSRVELDTTSAHASVYEARRAGDEVKLMVQNGSCIVEKVWLDD